LSASALAAAPEPNLTLDLGRDGNHAVAMQLVLVRAGRFLQGSPADEQGRADDEAQREVTLTRDFYVDTREVTLQQYRRFVEETHYRTEAEKGDSGGFGWDGHALVQRKEFTWLNPGFATADDHPVTLVTYDDALAFAAWLGRRSRRVISLPTEAQWEYAARAASGGRYYAGAADAVASQIGWWKANAGGGTHPVAQKQPNAWGLYDTSGNVYEWCKDWYAPYTPGPVTDPEETRSTLSDKPRRVLRGGSWLKDARSLRSAARYRSTPGTRNADIGFRVVAQVEAAPAAAPPPPGPAATSPPQRLISLDEEGALGKLAGLVAIVAALGVGVFALGRRLLGGLGRRQGMHAEQAPDGFRVFAPGFPAGTVVRYRYAVQGREESGEVTMTGDPDQGVFVYTGESPTRISLQGALPGPSAVGTAGAAGVLGSTRRAGVYSSSVDDDDDPSGSSSSSSSSSPPAY
jgi:formylglycine-generating enzyme required for sulfatase activity